MPDDKQDNNVTTDEEGRRIEIDEQGRRVFVFEGGDSVPPASLRVVPADPEHRATPDDGSRPTAELFAAEPYTEGSQSDLPENRRGYFSVDSLLNFEGLVAKFLAGQVAEEAAAKDTAGSVAVKDHVSEALPPASLVNSSTASVKQPPHSLVCAHTAFVNALNFLDSLIELTPKGKRGRLQKIREEMSGPPRNIFGEQVVDDVQQFFRSVGYYGPVLFYQIAGLCLRDLVEANLLDTEWWSVNDKVMDGLPTQYPWHPPEVTHDTPESGYWYMAFPGMWPGSSRHSFDEQKGMLQEIARTVGLQADEYGVLPGEGVSILVREVHELAMFFAQAQFLKCHASDLVLGVRANTRAVPYDPEQDQGRKAYEAEFGPQPSVEKEGSMYGACQVVLEFGPNRKLSIRDMDDNSGNRITGICPFILPRISRQLRSPNS